MLLRKIASLRQAPKNTALAIGNFDGVHKGHQHILSHIQSIASTYKVPTCVLLFEPQPKEYFGRQGDTSRIMTLREKYETLVQYGIDCVICLRFDQSLAHVSHGDFYHHIIEEMLQPRYIVVGQDFRFGYQRLGDVDFLQKACYTSNIDFEAMAPYRMDGVIVSSSYIRALLMQRDFIAARTYLARAFSISGRVLLSDTQEPYIKLSNICCPADGSYQVKIYNKAIFLFSTHIVIKHINTCPISAVNRCAYIYLPDKKRLALGLYITVQF